MPEFYSDGSTAYHQINHTFRSEHKMVKESLVNKLNYTRSICRGLCSNWSEIYHDSNTEQVRYFLLVGFKVGTLIVWLI